MFISLVLITKILPFTDFSKESLCIVSQALWKVQLGFYLGKYISMRLGLFAGESAILAADGESACIWFWRPADRPPGVRWWYRGPSLRVRIPRR